MIDFSAYRHKDLQHCMQLLNQCEAKGITDIRFVRETLHKYLYQPQKIRPIRRKPTSTSRPTCPSCGKGVLVKPCPAEKIDNENILRCSKKCGYSKVIA